MYIRRHSPNIRRVPSYVHEMAFSIVVKIHVVHVHMKALAEYSPSAYDEHSASAFLEGTKAMNDEHSANIRRLGLRTCQEGTRRTFVDGLPGRYEGTRRMFVRRTFGECLPEGGGPSYRT